MKRDYRGAAVAALLFMIVVDAGIDAGEDYKRRNLYGSTKTTG
jgi:hypothetical protein